MAWRIDTSSKATHHVDSSLLPKFDDEVQYGLMLGLTLESLNAPRPTEVHDAEPLLRADVQLYNYTLRVITERAREIIELIEPSRHSFSALKHTGGISNRDDRKFSLLEIGNIFDAISLNHSNRSIQEFPRFEFRGHSLGGPEAILDELDFKAVLSKAKFGKAQLWRGRWQDKVYTFCSDQMKDALEKAELTGIEFRRCVEN